MIKLYLSGCKRKNLNRAFSFILTVVFVVNICAMIKIKTHGSENKEYSSICQEIIESSASYLESKINEDFSVGDNKTINDTTDALLALRKVTDNQFQSSEKWVSDNISDINIDKIARLSAASGNSAYLSSIESLQNSDGGFGLYSGYSSDVLDSLLVLDALNETGYSGSNISAMNLCTYLIASVNDDGGFSYNDSNESDPVLSAMAAYSICRFFNINSYNSSSVEKIIDYLDKAIADEFSDASLEKTVLKYLTYSQYGMDFDSFELLDKLAEAQKSDGSFAGNVHVTSLVIRLLKNLRFENYIRVTGFDTVLDNSSASTAQSSDIQGTTHIEYTSNYDASLKLVFNVYNGENLIYENISNIILPKEESGFDITSGEFCLSEPSDNGVYVEVSLYDGDKLIDSHKIDIEVTSQEKVYSTEISKLSVNLDSQTAFTGTDKEVKVQYELLYATNIERNIQIKTVVTKDGKEITSVTENVALLPEKNIVSGEPLSFKPDTTVEGKYDVTVICIYENEEICKSKSVFTVEQAPVIEEPTEGEPIQFEVTWFGPILSDYYVYSGNDTEISAGVEINYYSNDVFNGSSKLSVYNGEECVAETVFDVSLEKGVASYFEGKANFPIYKNESQIKFKVNKTAEYTVYAELYDSQGTLIAEGKRILEVIDKPVQDLILKSEIDSETENMVNLSWNDISNDAESYSYQLYRNSDGSSWEPRSIWNEEESIDVLNIYPSSPYLVDWMNTTISNTELPAGKGIFNIDSVYFPTFNSDPYSCLLDEKGAWKYDVIFFGSSDCNSGFDLNAISSEALQKFIDSGRGVLFGHDTICGGSSNVLYHRYFNDFAEQAGLVVRTPSPEVWYRTTSVSVVKIGTLTNYPWNIRGDLTVPNTHSTGQYLLDATEWITLNAQKRVDEATGAIDNFYLCTKNNIGMIQTGDSTGQASDDERKILANTLFYLYQISQQTTAKDASFYDIDAPDKPTLVSSGSADGKLRLNVKSKDNATPYEYYIKATPFTEGEEEILSNIEKHETMSGLAGFVVGINNSSEASPELIEYDEKREFILNIVSADENGAAQISVEPTDFTQPQYVHIFAVDKANNISEEYIIPFAETDLSTNIRTDKKLYSNGDVVEIDTDTISAPFGRTADMTIEILDEFDNKTAELSVKEAQPLIAEENFINSVTWEIPSSLTGRYKAVISWKNGEEVLAEDETIFKIANETSIFNTVSSDKKSYSLQDPINLESIVYNNSMNMIENDLVLLVDVYNSSSVKVSSFEHEVSLMNPKDDRKYSDAIAPGKLAAGKYIINARVMQGDMEISNDSSEFSVVEDISSFEGDLKLNSEANNKATAEFSVTNKGRNNAENVIITVNVYKEGSSECVYTYKEIVSIGAGETITRKESFEPALPADGTYSGVLSIEYLNEKQPLDYDGFEIISSVKTPENNSKPSIDSPQTGTDDIPVYMWIISILSLAGIVLLRKTGVNENEEN